MASLNDLRCCAMGDLECSNSDSLADLRKAINGPNDPDYVDNSYGDLPDEDYTTVQAITHSRGDGALVARLKRLGFKKVNRIPRREGVLEDAATKGRFLDIWHLIREIPSKEENEPCPCGEPDCEE